MTIYKGVNFQQEYRRQNDKADEVRHNRGLAIQILELSEEGKKVSEIIDLLDINQNQYRKAKCFLSDDEKRTLSAYIKRNAYKKPKVLSREEYSAYLRLRFNGKK